MIREEHKCPICGETKEVRRKCLSRSFLSYECPACGAYQAPFSWAGGRQSELPNRKLSAWVREQNELGNPPRLTKQMIEQLRTSVPDYKPSEKQLKLLQAIERQSAHPGDEVLLTCAQDFPLAYAENMQEFEFYLQAMQKRKLIQVRRHKELTDTLYGRTLRAWITALGWDHLEKHASDLREKKQAFVAMWFSEGMKGVFNKAIKPAIEEAGYTPYRVDMKPHGDLINVRIMAEIKNSRFIVAEFTGQRHGVYFEAGYALGLGIPVIWCVKKKDAKDIHFDTKPFNYIRWKSKEELKRTLFDFICAIIGKQRAADC